jgi:hypothetical protein
MSGLALVPFYRMGPPPRSLAAEAYDCFMVRIRHGSNRIQGCAAMLRVPRRAPLGSFVITIAHIRNEACDTGMT